MNSKSASAPGFHHVAFVPSRLYKFHHSHLLVSSRRRNILSVPFLEHPVQDEHGPLHSVVDLNAWPIALNPSERRRISPEGASRKFPRFALPSSTRNFIISLGECSRSGLPGRFNIGMRSM